MVKIYTDEECPHCKKLKKGLIENNIEFIEINVDLPEYKEEVESLFKLAGEPIIPIIVLKPHVLVPRKTFNTIDDALKIIINLINKT